MMAVAAGNIARQMMIGNQYLHAQPIGFGYAFNAGNAIIDGEQDIRLFGGMRKLYDFRGQSVTEFKAVGTR